MAQRFGLTGRVDLYHAFVVAMWSALATDGVLALLTSNRFMTIQSGAAMRRLLRENLELREIHDLGDTKLFEAAVLPAIIIGIKSAKGDTSPDEPEFGRVYEERSAAVATAEFASPLDALREKYSGVFRSGGMTYRSSAGKLQLSGTSDQPWVLDSESSRGWLASVKKHTAHRFTDIGEVRVGIKTTADNVFIQDDWSKQPSDKQPEDVLLRPLLTHHIVQRWLVPGPTKSSVLYPHYTDENGKRRAYKLNEFPRAGRYLETHREQLEGRKYVAEAGRGWHEIWVPQQPADWKRPKVVYPDIAESPTFFLDTAGRIVNGDCYWIVLKDGIEADWLLLLLGVANSSFIVAYYDAVFHNKLYAGRRRFMTQYVREFPLPPLDSTSGRLIVQKVKAMLRKNADSSTDELERELDALVWTAFGIKDRAACGLDDHVSHHLNVNGTSKKPDKAGLPRSRRGAKTGT